MYRDRCFAHMYSFIATAEVEGPTGVRSARVFNRSILATYLVMADAFSKVSSLRVTVRIKTFHLTLLLCIRRTPGMGVACHAVSPPLQIVLQRRSS